MAFCNIFFTKFNIYAHLRRNFVSNMFTFFFFKFLTYGNERHFVTRLFSTFSVWFHLFLFLFCEFIFTLLIPQLINTIDILHIICTLLSDIIINFLFFAISMIYFNSIVIYYIAQRMIIINVEILIYFFECHTSAEV